MMKKKSTFIYIRITFTLRSSNIDESTTTQNSEVEYI